MKAKKYLMAAIALSTVLLAFAATRWPVKHGDITPSRPALAGPGGKFGPIIETVLPPATARGAIGIFDLEAGRPVVQPSFEHFDYRADAIMAWIRSNRLDLSCSAWSNNAACVTHDMNVVAVEGKCWMETPEEELINHPALALERHYPRRLLVLGPGRPDTYMFRTGEGTLGMLQIVGLSQDGLGVNIRYKLINPDRSPSVASAPFESGPKY